MNSTSFLQNVWRWNSVIFLFCSKWAALGADLALAITTELSHQPCTLSPRISAYCFLTNIFLPHREVQHQCKKKDFRRPLSMSSSLIPEKGFKAQDTKGKFWHRWTLLSYFAEAKWESRQVRRGVTSHCREQTFQHWDSFRKLKW